MKREGMKFVKGVFLTLFCLQVSLAVAQGQSVDELIIKSGLQRQVQQYPDVIKASFEERFRQDKSMSAADRYNLRTAASEAFDPVKMLKIVREGVAAGFTEQDISDILKWLNSPLGIKITQLEEKASSGASYREMMDYAQNMPEPEPQRLVLVERLDTAAQLTKYTSQMKIDVVLAMGEAMACASGCENFSREQTVQQLEKIRPQMEEGSRQEVMLNSLFSYQSLTDEELEAYIKFYETAAGQKYMQVMTLALSEAVKDASKTMGEKMGAVLKDKKTASAEGQ